MGRKMAKVYDDAKANTAAAIQTTQKERDAEITEIVKKATAAKKEYKDLETSRSSHGEHAESGG